MAALMEQAQEASGLEDWGDTSFVPTVELLLDSCAETARLTAAGGEVLHKVVLRHLRNRLYLQAFLAARHRAGDLPSVVAPLFVTGLPRTGTTLLHNLLALDPAHRVLRFWEALHPVPPDPSRGTSEEALVARAGAWLERTYALSPSMRAIHAATARGPEECDALLQNAFASQHFDDMFRAEAYSEWLNGADLVPEYAYYALQLRVLATTGQAPGGWVLKSPSHLGYLKTVLSAFPDTVVVHCHRRPAEAVASYASLVMAVRAPHTTDVDPAEVGRHSLRRCTVAVRRAGAARDEAGERPFLDIAYGSLVGQPMAAVRRIYAARGRALEDDVEARMRAWLADNPRHRHGRHDYDLARFGLTAGQVGEALATYTRRFGALL